MVKILRFCWMEKIICLNKTWIVPFKGKGILDMPKTWLFTCEELSMKSTLEVHATDFGSKPCIHQIQESHYHSLYFVTNCRSAHLNPEMVERLLILSRYQRGTSLQLIIKHLNILEQNETNSITLCLFAYLGSMTLQVTWGWWTPTHRHRYCSNLHSFLIMSKGSQ